MRRLLLASLILALAASACADDSGSDEPAANSSEQRSPSSESTSTGTITWTGCGSGLDCAELSVPLDYDDPDGEQITIALARRPAEDPDARVGSLLVNPGGPGGSGLQLVELAPQFIGSDVLERFDIVGFDPRGVGQSTPVECTDDLDFLFAVDTEPDTEQEHRELQDAARTFAGLCAENSAELLPFVGTENVARDMDRIRAGLGEEQLNYLGFSYGTYLGALYADLFPDRVRAFVLDGAVDPSLDTETAAVEQSLGFEKQFDEFLAECGDDESCDFYSGGDPEAAYDDLLARIEREPLESADGRELGPGETDLAVATALYDGQFGFEGLARALAAAEAGDPDLLLALFDSYVGRDPSGEYDNSQEAFLAISCVDGVERFTPEQYDALAQRVGAAAPRFGETGVNLGYACVYWPAEPSGLEGPFAAEGAAPILVIGTQGDPATPPEWAEALADQLESGVLLRLDARGHTAYGQGYGCIDDAVADYLVDLDLPADGTLCEV